MPDMTAKQPEQQPLPPPVPPYDDGTPDILDPPVPPEAMTHYHACARCHGQILCGDRCPYPTLTAPQDPRDCPVCTAAPTAQPPAPAPLPPLVLQHEALLQGFCTALQERLSHWILDHHKNMERVLDVTYAACKSRLEAIGTQNEHANYQMSDALLKLHEGGLQITHNPYEATIEAVSPQGFPVQLHLVKKDAGGLIEAVQGVTAWLASAGYQVPVGVQP